MSDSSNQSPPEDDESSKTSQPPPGNQGAGGNPGPAEGRLPGGYGAPPAQGAPQVPPGQPAQPPYGQPPQPPYGQAPYGQPPQQPSGQPPQWQYPPPGQYPPGQYPPGTYPPPGGGYPPPGTVPGGYGPYGQMPPAAGYGAGYGAPAVKSKTTAVVLAVFFSFWSWCYTWKRNRVKWAISLAVLAVLVVISFTTGSNHPINVSTTVNGHLTTKVEQFRFNSAAIGLWVLAAIGTWIWAVIDNAVKSESWYRNYPNG